MRTARGATRQDEKRSSVQVGKGRVKCEVEESEGADGRVCRFGTRNEIRETSWWVGDEESL
jgi:hypothetical protein